MPRLLIAVSLLAVFAAAQPPREIGKGVNFYTIEKEIALGRQLAADFQRETKSLESPVALAYITSIGQRLAADIGGPPFTYTFALVADDPSVMHEVAAFPGGFLFVPASLILAAKDEDELAGMLAHAVAHVADRHDTRQATRGEIMDKANMPVVYMGGWAEYAMRQGSASIPLGLISVWRSFELRADRLAARVMADIGYDPRALVRYIEREQSSYRQPMQQVFSPLPARARRIDAINLVIASLPVQTYSQHEGLEKIQQEVRRAVASAAAAKQEQQ